MVESKMENVTVRLPTRFIRALDFLVEVDDFPSRSEAIRSAIRDMVYDRVDMVMERIEKLEEAERTLASMETFEEKYLQK